MLTCGFRHREEVQRVLAPFQSELLGLLPGADPAALRWHLAQMLPRLPLTPGERQLAAAWLRDCLKDRSSIVKTCAMEMLARMADRRDAAEMIRSLMETGPPYANMRLPPP